VVSLGGVWAWVPENGQVYVVAGALVGLVLVAEVVGSGLSRPAIGVLAAVVAWSVAAGYAFTDVRYVGGLLCLGLLLWWPLLRAPLAALDLGRLSVIGVAHAALVAVAARWVAAAADATWLRVWVVLGAGLVLATGARLLSERGHRISDRPHA
jgi:hypothetical protein